MARVERGMRIEINLIPPPAPAPDDVAAKENAARFQDLERTAQKLTFPAVQGEPVLALPPSEPPTVP